MLCLLNYYNLIMHMFVYICHIYNMCITAAEYANLPLIPPFLQPGFHNYYDGVNFASAGAGVLVETFQGSVCIYMFHNVIYTKA